jgi:hypothetical protein
MHGAGYLLVVCLSWITSFSFFFAFFFCGARGRWPGLHRHLARLVRQEVRELIEKVRLVLEQLSDLLVDLSDPKCVRAGVLLRVPAPRTKSVNLCMLCDGNFVGTSREIRP